MTIAFNGEGNPDGVPVLPGDENPTCDSCAHCHGREVDLHERDDPLCWSFVARDGSSDPRLKKVDPDDLACDVYRQRRFTPTFTERLAKRRRKQRLRAAEEHDGVEMTERQRRDDAEQLRRDTKHHR